MLLAILCLTHMTTLLSAMEFTLSTLNQPRNEYQLAITLPENVGLIHDTLSFTTNHPDLNVVPWKIQETPQKIFDKHQTNAYDIYNNKVTCILTMTPQEQPFTLFMHFMTTDKKFPQERQFIIEPSTVPPATQSIDAAITPDISPLLQTPHASYATAVTPHAAPSIPQFIYEGMHLVHTFISNTVTQTKKWASELLTSTTSPLTQYTLVFILGILMSLTPCIYPMIPVTIGLLGSSPGNSLARNFSLACSYTLGLSFTFAMLGLFAVLFGIQCGSLVCNPWVVITMVTFLAYLGGSMFGWYELYIPRFLRPHSGRRNHGSLLSAACLGVLSGTISSPCVSPGLALVLSIVATLKNVFHGFMLLFIFGFGTALPLLIIGTFSGSLHLMPRAGSWMNEIKKLFGFIMIMTCFSYLQTVVPLHFILWSSGIFSLCAGLLYSTNIFQRRGITGTVFTSMVSIVLITIGLYQLYKGTTTWLTRNTVLVDTKLDEEQTEHHHGIWHDDYTQGRELAKKEHKFMLLDFTADYCSACTELDRAIFSQPEFEPLLHEVVAIKVDGSTQSPDYKKIIKQYNVFGLPTILLVEPHAEEAVASWNSSISYEPVEQFIASVRTALSKATTQNQ